MSSSVANFKKNVCTSIRMVLRYLIAQLNMEEPATYFQQVAL